MKQPDTNFDSAAYLREQNRVMDRIGIGDPATEGNLARHSPRDLLIALQTFLGELSARAIQNPEAAENLWTFAHTACADLWEVCERKPEIMRPFVAKKLTFPVHFPVLKKHQERVVAMMKSLGVGTNSRYRIGKKQFDPNVPVNALVLRWVEHICETQRRVKFEIAARYRAKILDGERPAMSIEEYVNHAVANIKEPHLKQIMALPPLHRNYAGKWAGAIWEMVLLTNAGKPQENKELRIIGEYRRKHTESSPYKKNVSQGIQNGNIRDGIKTRIFRTVRELANQSPTNKRVISGEVTI